MKILVTGSRDWVKSSIIVDAFIPMHRDSLIIDGMARGADALCYEVTKELGFMNHARFRAQWDEYKARGWNWRKAGPDRNRLMFDTTRPDVVFAFPLPQSKGTVDMMEYAESKGCPVIVFAP